MPNVALFVPVTSCPEEEPRPRFPCPLKILLPSPSVAPAICAIELLIAVICVLIEFVSLAIDTICEFSVEETLIKALLTFPDVPAMPAFKLADTLVSAVFNTEEDPPF